MNTASRLESKGEVYKVNINDTTYELVKDFFDCEYRGEITVKHGVLISMYFVLQIKPELSKNGEGMEPNEPFKAKKKLLSLKQNKSYPP